MFEIIHRFFQRVFQRTNIQIKHRKNTFLLKKAIINAKSKQYLPPLLQKLQ